MVQMDKFTLSVRVERWPFRFVSGRQYWSGHVCGINTLGISIIITIVLTMNLPAAQWLDHQ